MSTILFFNKLGERSTGYTRTLLEKLLILVIAITYLWIFNQTLAHGDALRIVHQIEASDLIWNPNHLIFDPLGYGFYLFISYFLPNAIPLACFEFLSVIATLLSLLIFHTILIRSGVRQPLVRLLAVAGLFASASFLALAGSQYYFMVQMPLLLGALYLYIDFFLKLNSGQSGGANLYKMGVLLALATAIMFNNLLLVIAAGLAVGFMHPSWKRWDFRNTLQLYVAAAMVGFPIFIGGYFLSDTTNNLIDWLLSYQGDSASKLNELYGARWTMSGVLQGIAKTGFNLMLGSLVEHAGLGTVLHVVVFGQKYEFIPQWSNILLSLLLIPAVIAVNLSVVFFIFRRVLAEPAVRFLASWLLAFVLFNFLWNTNEEIFWIQTIPAVWLLLLLMHGAMSEPVLVGNAFVWFRVLGNWKWRALAVFVCLLLIVNTINLIVPLAASDYYQKQSRHVAMLRDGDLEILPGWDRQKWMMLSKEGPNVRRLFLMNMALAATGSGEEMQRLPEIVESHLHSGGELLSQGFLTLMKILVHGMACGTQAGHEKRS